MARPTLPRIRRGRARGIAGEVVEQPEPRIAELSANGLTWVHVDEPGPLEAAALDDLFDYCFPILDKIGYKLDAIEDGLFEGRSEEIVRDISNAKQEIIAYRKIIKPERATLRVLERYTERFLPEEMELYFDDIVDATERIWDLLDNYKEVVEALEQTNESVISHRVNRILQILTIFSVILLPLTLIAGILGMNVTYPGNDSSASFWVIVA